jgi:hypothetical protein
MVEVVTRGMAVLPSEWVPWLHVVAVSRLAFVCGLVSAGQYKEFFKGPPFASMSSADGEDDMFHWFLSISSSPVNEPIWAPSLVACCRTRQICVWEPCSDGPTFRM